MSRYLAARPAFERPSTRRAEPQSHRLSSRRRFSIALPRAARLLFLGGKGGVGKTTVAAGMALQLARTQPRRRILLLSTDPAHSLGDVFEAELGDRPRALRGGPANLRVRELDAARALAARRRDLQAALEQIADTVGAAALVSGEAAAGHLLELAPPGIDELLGLISIFESLPSADDLVVIDTAPTGHALRLLEMPATARAWVQTMMRMLLKYRDLVRPGSLAAELVALSKSIGRLQQLIRNPRQAHFIVVTRAAALPRLETARLLDRLQRLQVDVPLVVVNALTLAAGACPRCRQTAAAERRELALMVDICRRRRRDCDIIQTPLIEPPPRGAAALERWTREWAPIR